MNNIDLIFVLLYLLFLVYIAIRLWKNKKENAEDFLLAGRQLTLPSFIATLVSTWYGGILGVGEFTYLYGISNWLVFGVPYYFAAFIFAMFLAKRSRRSQIYTIPHQLDIHYGKAPSILGAFIVFIMTTPAAYVLMLAILINFILGWPLIVGLVVGTLFSLCYVWNGGFRSVIRTDIVQFLLMFSAFILILPFCVYKFGGFAFLQQNLPASHFVWHGGQGAQYIFVWYFIALATLVDSSFYQRCFAAKTETVAKRGILYSILFWIFFDFLTTTTGLYARAALPNLANPVSSFVELSLLVLPIGLQGLFLVGLLATIMSTIDSYSFISAMSIGRDILWRLRDGKNEININKYTRIGLVLSAIVSITIAYWAQSVITIWKEMGSIGTPALLIPLASSFSDRWKMRPSAAFLTMISGGALSGFWAITKNIEFFGGKETYLLGIEPIFPGLAITLIIFCVDNYLKRQ
jgi:solute:Na+ symporter, SSS family